MKLHKIEIDDLDESEAETVKKFLLDAIDSDELPALQDCVTVYAWKEIEYGRELVTPHWVEVK